MDTPIWWGVYIGPQQMKEPNGDGPGCMIYPLQPCETQPRVTVRDIYLKNVTSVGSILPAGILRCNETNPCQNFVFEDVQLRSSLWDHLGIGFISEFVEGHTSNVFPDPKIREAGFFSRNSVEPLADTLDIISSMIDFQQVSMIDVVEKVMKGKTNELF